MKILPKLSDNFKVGDIINVEILKTKLRYVAIRDPREFTIVEVSKHSYALRENNIFGQPIGSYIFHFRDWEALYGEVYLNNMIIKMTLLS